MAKETTMDWAPLIDRMKAEGQLTRNTGTNSIKSVNANLDNLTGVFKTISQQLVMQGSFLESAYNIQSAQYELDRERGKDAERLARLEQPEPEAPTAAEPKENDNDSESKKDKQSGPSLLSSLFSSSNFLKAATVGVAAPFVYGFLKGAIDQVTGGKFSEFETALKTTIPDVFKNIKNIFRTIYTNITTFLETGNIEDLLKNEAGETIIDVEALKTKAGQYAGVAMALLIGGPLAGIAAAVAGALQDTLKEYTGIDIAEHLGPGANAALIGLTGLGLKAAIGSAVTGGLIRGAFVALFTNPFGIAALAVAAGIFGLMAAAKAGRERVDKMTQEMEDHANEYEAAIEAGDTEKAQELERAMAANAQRLTDRVGGLGPNNEETINRNLAALQQMGGVNLRQQLEAGSEMIAREDIDAANERMRALAQYANVLERSDITAEDRLEAMRNIVRLLPENRRREIEDADLSEGEGRVQAMGLLQQLGVKTGFGGNPELEGQLGNLLNEYLAAQMAQGDGLGFRREVDTREVVGDTWAERTFPGFEYRARERQAEWDSTYGQFYNDDGSLKLNVLSQLTDAMREQALGGGFAVNTGGNTFVGGSQSSASSTVYNFNGGGMPAQALSNGPHQQ